MARQPTNEPLQLQDARGRHDLRRNRSGADDQFVDAGVTIVKLTQERSFLIGEGQFSGMTDGGSS
jgi:hypothetical protein